MTEDSNILYLFNPQSDEGKSGHNWQRAHRQFPLLPEKPVDITQISDLAGFIKEKNPKIVVIAGGDGTINRVCSEVIKLKHRPMLSIIPFGFGNALSYCLGVETKEKAIAVLQKRPESLTIDLLKTNIGTRSIGVFNIGVGFDASIVHNRINYRYIGLRSYVISILRSVVTHPEKEIRFTIDHTVTLNATASALVIANCPVLGQNLLVSPSAKLNDGLLDCTVFSTKYAYLTNLRLRGFKHPLYSELGKIHFKAKHIRIEGEPFAQVDGDPVLHKEGIEVEILPAQVTFLRNSNDEISQEYLPFVS